MNRDDSSSQKPVKLESRLRLSKERDEKEVF